MNKVKVTGIILAVSAAAAFALAPTVSTAGHGSHKHCMGVNACKGKSSCKASESSCKGKNSCKGKGWVKMSESQCDQIGGTWE